MKHGGKRVGSSTEEEGGGDSSSSGGGGKKETRKRRERVHSHAHGLDLVGLRRSGQSTGADGLRTVGLGGDPSESSAKDWGDVAAVFSTHTKPSFFKAAFVRNPVSRLLAVMRERVVC
mmetsp:Transcript_64739/g.121337  ORF Transcript_64739/g.121337 Transcript_64739/m.121337 type:complete len:118 (+) Transcript_64739:1203-1556(+)